MRRRGRPGLSNPFSALVSRPSPRIRAVYDTRRDRQRGGIGSGFEPAKALVRGLDRCLPESFR